MAETPGRLVPCRQCGKPISPAAESCPHCGSKVIGAYYFDNKSTRPVRI